MNFNWLNKKLGLITVIAGLVAVSQPLLAAHVLPQFVGFWYSKATPLMVDTCMQTRYQYDKVVSGTQIYTKAATPAKPTDFIGNDNDWQQLSGNSNSVFNKSYWVKTANGVMVQVYPASSCPQGSSYTQADYGKSNYGCSTTPKPCVADAVARQLGIPLLKAMGHIGMISSGVDAKKNYQPTILEVLDKPKVVNHHDPLIGFIHNQGTKYFGERGFYSTKQPLSLQQGEKIIQTGAVQANFNPTYTFIWWGSHPGGIEAQYIYDAAKQAWTKIPAATRNAKFRCDYFVYYSYIAGLGIKIHNFLFNVFPVPTTLFHAFQTARLSYNGAENNAQLLQLQLNNIQANLAANNFIWQESAISSLLAANKFSVYLTDAALKNYLASTTITRTEKIQFLWLETQKYSNNEIKFGYLIDALATLKPATLASQFIANYQQQSNVNNKLKLLNLLADCTHYNVQPTDTTDLTQAVITIQQFFTNLLHTEHNNVLLKQAMTLYASIMPATTAYSTINTMVKSANSDLFTPEQYYFQQIGMALATPEAQQELLPQLLTKVQNPQAFNDALYTRIKLMPYDSLTNSAKNLLVNYIASQQPSLQNSSLTAAKQYYAWMKAYAIVTSQNQQQVSELIARRLLQIHNPTLLGKVMFVADKAVLKNLAPSESTQIKDFLAAATADNQVGNANQSIYIKAAACRLE